MIHAKNSSGADLILIDVYEVSLPQATNVEYRGHIEHHIGDKKVKRIKSSAFGSAWASNMQAHQWIRVYKEGERHHLHISPDELEKYDECELELEMEKDDRLAYKIRQMPKSPKSIWGTVLSFIGRH